MEEPLEPQYIKDWKKEQEEELRKHIKVTHGKEYVPYATAKNFMSRYFTKGFKSARRDRTSLADYLIEEMNKCFIVVKKGE